MLQTLTPSQQVILACLSDNGSEPAKLDIASLAERTGLSQHRVLELVAQLQAQGVLTLNSTVPAKCRVNWPKQGPLGVSRC